MDGYLHSRLLLMMRLRPGWELHISRCVEESRMIKESDAIDRLRFVSEATDRAFAEAFGNLRECITELEPGRIFSECFDHQGIGPLNGDPMVCFGVGSSQPHHAPGAIKLRRGDAVTVDTGKRFNGYYSDMTRTVFFGHYTKKQRKVYDTGLNANLAALAAICPELTVNG